MLDLKLIQNEKLNFITDSDDDDERYDDELIYNKKDNEKQTNETDDELKRINEEFKLYMNDNTIVDIWDIEDKIKSIKIFIDSLYQQQYNYIANFNIFVDELPREVNLTIVKNMEELIEEYQQELDTN